MRAPVLFLLSYTLRVCRGTAPQMCTLEGAMEVRSVPRTAPALGGSFYSPLDCVFSHTVRRGSCHSQRSKGSQEKAQREQSLAWIFHSLLKGLELVGLDEAFQFQVSL